MTVATSSFKYECGRCLQIDLDEPITGLRFDMDTELEAHAEDMLAYVDYGSIVIPGVTLSDFSHPRLSLVIRTSPSGGARELGRYIVLFGDPDSSTAGRFIAELQSNDGPAFPEGVQILSDVGNITTSVMISARAGIAYFSNNGGTPSEEINQSPGSFEHQRYVPQIRFITMNDTPGEIYGGTGFNSAGLVMSLAGPTLYRNGDVAVNTLRTYTTTTNGIITITNTANGSGFVKSSKRTTGTYVAPGNYGGADYIEIDGLVGTYSNVTTTSLYRPAE